LFKSGTPSAGHARRMAIASEGYPIELRRMELVKPIYYDFCFHASETL
jgi:hypothetical protein